MRHSCPFGLIVHAPAHMGSGVSVLVVPNFDGRFHQRGIQIISINLGHIVVLDCQMNGIFQIALEREVLISLVQNQCARCCVFCWKSQTQTARPIGDSAWCCGEAPAAANHGTFQIDGQIGSGRRRNAHFFCTTHHFHAHFHALFKLGIRANAFQNIGMLVGDHQHARPAFQNSRQFGGMKQTFKCAIDNQSTKRKSCHNRCVKL